MAKQASDRWITLLHRELLEYKNSLVWTPIGVVIALACVMLISVIFANRLTVLGDALLQVVVEQEATSGTNITIHIDDDDPAQSSYRIERQQGPVTEEDWNFAKDWQFSPKTGPELQQKLEEKVESLNPFFDMLHSFMLLILVAVTVNYLLGCLYDDRKDRSILFWKSMPVSEWDEVLAKLCVALVVAPAIFIAASLAAQVITLLLAMVIVWRMDMDPFRLVLGNIDFGRLVLGQVGGWIVTALLAAPIYAWLLSASAAARRSPFLLAVAPFVALVVLEAMFFGSDHVRTAVFEHIPSVGTGTTLDGYFPTGDGGAINLVSMLLGLALVLPLVWAAVMLRRHRWEL